MSCPNGGGGAVPNVVKVYECSYTSRISALKVHCRQFWLPALSTTIIHVDPHIV